MDQVITTSECVASIFDARDSSYSHYTSQLETQLTPNVLSALRILFELPDEDVRWVGFDTFDDMLVVIAHVRYPTDAQLSPYLKWSTGASKKSHVDDTTIAELHYCMPFDLMDQTAEEVAKMLMDAMISGQSQIVSASGPIESSDEGDSTAEVEPVPAPAAKPDGTALTPEQMASYAFWSSPKPTVH